AGERGAGVAATGRITGLGAVAGVAIVAGEGGARVTAAGRVAGLDAIAGVAVVTDERRARLTACGAAAGLDAVARVAVVAERIRSLVDLPVAIVVLAVAQLRAVRVLHVEGRTRHAIESVRGVGRGRVDEVRVAAAGGRVGGDLHRDVRAHRERGRLH